MYSINFNRNYILYAKGQNGEEDEEKSANIKSINSRLARIEKKLTYLLEKDSKDYVTESDFPKFHFSNKENLNSHNDDNSNTSNSLLQRVLNEKIWNRLHMLTSQEGFNINDIIQPGIDNPSHPIGLVAYSKDCYYTFDDILMNAAQIYHKRNIYLNKYEKENIQMLLSIINSMDTLLEKSIHSIKISTNRNLDNFPFSGKINRNQRREITNKFYEAIKKYENEEKGKFSFFDGKADIENVLNKNSGKFDYFFQACGFYKDFPDGRMVYKSNDSKISLLTNLEDHIKITLNINNENKDLIQGQDNNNKSSGFSVKNLIEYFEFINKLNNEFNFCFDENLGYLNSLINNIGKYFLKFHLIK